jgi:ATP-binding cassette subfamily E protein 1
VLSLCFQEDNLKCIIKPQYVDHIPKAVKGTVDAVINAKADRGNLDEMMAILELNHVRDRQVIRKK